MDSTTDSIGPLTPCQSTSSQNSNVLTPKPVQNWAANFKIPWEKLPKSFHEKLENSIHLSLSARREVVRVVSHDIMDCVAKPHRKDLREICLNIAEKYPTTFRDFDAKGGIIDNGIGKLLSQFEDRFANEAKKINAKRNLNETYHNSEESINPISINEQTEIKKELIDYFENPLHSNEDQPLDVKKLMDSSFELRASDCKNMTVDNIVKEWPFLFSSTDFIKEHFKKLTSTELNVNLMSKIDKTMIDFIKQSKKFLTKQFWKKATFHT